MHVSPLMVSNETLRDLEKNLVMFFTGYYAQAHLVLTEQRTRSDRATMHSRCSRASTSSRRWGSTSKTALETRRHGDRSPRS